ncbi:MAG TPA: ABC transporter substrate-binding protein [Methylomirabilota bacterium]|jgi:NitT/TauT family transport system substrate-binding protein|nr:ABC transporter substrate-binding protein [Methylomirabilota bacterium]
MRVKEIGLIRRIGPISLIVCFLASVTTDCVAHAQLTRLKTSYSALTANMAAYWLAKESGIFEKHGLNVDVVLIESGVTTVQALAAGETQIAMGGGTVAVSSNLAGSDIVSIASLESRLPYALLAQREIKTIDQLRGKRLAISRFGSASDLAARLILQRYGLAPDKDVTILQTGGTSTRLSALHKRSVDATILTPEFFNVAKKAGFSILAEPTQYDIPFPQLEVITTRAFLKSQPDVATRYLRAVVEGIHAVKNNPEPSIRALAKYLRIGDRDALEEVYRLYREIYPAVPHPSPAAIQTQLTWMAERDPRAKAAKPEQFIDGTILKEIEKSGFVQKLYQK